MPNQMIAASGTLVLVSGLGAVAGPLSIAAIMDYTDNRSFFICIGIAYLFTGCYAVYRIARRKFTPLTASGDSASHTQSPIRPSSSAIDWARGDDSE